MYDWVEKMTDHHHISFTATLENQEARIFRCVRHDFWILPETVIAPDSRAHSAFITVLYGLYLMETSSN